MTVFNGYPVSIFFATLLHVLIFAALFYFQQANTEVIDIVRPPAVKALLVAENPQAKNEELQRQQAQRVQDQRREEQRRQQQAEEQRRAEQQRREVEQQQRAQQQQRQEQEQREAEQRRVAEQQKQREEQQRRDAEQKRQQELAAQQEAQRQEQIRQQQALQAQQEAASAAAAEAARTDSELVMAYSAVIHDLVQQNWSRPPSARNGMVVVLRITMVPTGDVLDVAVVQSSGDFAFDRAAENAVLKVRRFTELQGMPTRLFDRNFRSFLLTFRPQDLLN